ncbi:RidA family protein [Glaciimonas soli]|uniref:RidA family protein n=1 Tax=Glaciimonas soli TaxID=2590999 RepID=A0A843YK80_9BURK|nr:RidA family protein [Glaciimonas soli]MQQ99369.1 RidA family protein [Glaciimonas soli]
MSTNKVQRLHVGKRLSEVAIHNGTIYLAGQLAEDTSQNIEGQTRETLGHIDRLLAESGSDKDHILSCQIYLADVKDFAGMNLEWDKWVSADNSPPRATVEAKLARADILIEIVIVAAQK